MSTTKKGRYIHRSTPYDVQLKKLWRVGPESSRLTVQYRMGHTLQDLGLELKPIDWTRVIVRRRSSGSGSSPPTTPPVSPGEKTSKDTNNSSLKDTTNECPKDTGRDSPPQSVAASNTDDKVESREINLDYSTTKIKEEPKDITPNGSMTHIQLVATS